MVWKEVRNEELFLNCYCNRTFVPVGEWYARRLWACIRSSYGLLVARKESHQTVIVANRVESKKAKQEEKGEIPKCLGGKEIE